MKVRVPTAEKISLPNVSERRQVHILNPKSGKRDYCDAAKSAIEKTGGEILMSEHQGQITELVCDLFTHDPFAHAVIYGGDGTVYEAVNGIMQSGHNATASFSVIPAGSGNDFSAYMNDSGAFAKAELVPLDLIRTECAGQVRYCANVTNMGFDCDVVRETYRLKKIPIFRGPAGYIAGVLRVLMKKKTIPAKIVMEGCCDNNGNPLTEDTLRFDKRLLLTACANAQFYGGGFHAAPIASVTDGLMDVLVVNNITRLKFISLVKDYHEGTFIGNDNKLIEKFSKVITYQKCRKITVEGPKYFCIDGEVLPTENTPVTAEVMQNAVWFAAL